MKEFKQTLYAIVDKKGNVYYHTLSNQKKDCIKYFLKDISFTWKEAKKYGWKCMKVDVHIMSASNLD